MTSTSEEIAAGKRVMRGPVWPLAVAVVAIAATVVLATVDPHEAGHYPTCPLLYLTGFWCPGCGSLRALHDLAHGDIIGAVGMNILTVLAVPYLIWRWGAWLAQSLGRPLRRRLAAPWIIWSVLAVIVSFAVARNIPVFVPYLAP